MHLVMNDFLECDHMVFSLPATALTRGATHSSMAENLGAVLESIGLELVEYGNQTRQLIRAGDKEIMRFQLAGEMWLSRQ